jgi:hypothetical protein
MAEYFVCASGVIHQLGMKFVAYDTIVEAIEDPGLELDPGETVAMLSLFGRMFELNLVSAAVWEYCAQGLPVDEVARRITQQFEVLPDAAARDVEQIVAEFEEFGLGQRRYR